MQSGSPIFNVSEYKAVGDGKTLDTSALQEAIDSCGAKGGGIVYFPPGAYLSGTLHLKSFISLHLEAGAILLGSPSQADYPVIPCKLDSRTNHYNLRSLIFAEGLERVAIQGRGAIDGNGSRFHDRRHDGSRPLNMRFIDCKDVLIEGVSIGNSGFWNQHYLGCERVRVRGISVWNHASYNVDAIDIDACRDFIVSDCVFDSDDDAVCLKSTMNRPCENVQITNCRISSHCNAIKLGTDSTGGFTDIVISNCTISSPRGSKALYGFDRGISGISLEIVDGGRMERVAISNITIEGVEVPLFIRLGARGVGMFPSKAELEAPHSVGTIDGVSIQNLVATGAGRIGCSITGIPGHEVESITLSNVSIVSDGKAHVEAVPPSPPENVDHYPEGTMFGVLPAFGMYCRHAKNLTLVNVRLDTHDSFEKRSALVLDDVQETSITGFSRTRQVESSADIELVNAKDILIQGCRPHGKEAFIKVAGKDSSWISLVGNDLSRIGSSLELAPSAPPMSVHLEGNMLGIPKID